MDRGKWKGNNGLEQAKFTNDVAVILKGKTKPVSRACWPVELTRQNQIKKGANPALCEFYDNLLSLLMK